MHTRARIHIKIVIAIFVFVSIGCRHDRYGPPRKHISDRKINGLQLGMTADEVQGRLGAPSLKWTKRMFEQQRYPSEARCQAAAPTEMWVYYQQNAPCLYFDNRKTLICVGGTTLS
jgi:hypothetical protein